MADIRDERGYVMEEAKTTTICVARAAKDCRGVGGFLSRNEAS